MTILLTLRGEVIGEEREREKKEGKKLQLLL